ncbi:hypothetical protein L202_04345 [Cryptococcus amylolentus CBS 6039]|uniref:Uncharacterized protein n=1 Tax=Cryptococcus amylolentus CBS 6039 TaxID=1295533 RepID=A0A1E3HR56_9TREE|nr:hypothetical protein L202_04345 [Cryptococcus amylolentus CBS 6039]ODN78792.1 hypothetical protein L202_04345 [Cryptococcus amylolentus CBS 6039]
MSRVSPKQRKLAKYHRMACLAIALGLPFKASLINMYTALARSRYMKRPKVYGKATSNRRSVSGNRKAPHKPKTPLSLHDSAGKGCWDRDPRSLWSRNSYLCPVTFTTFPTILDDNRLPNREGHHLPANASNAGSQADSGVVTAQDVTETHTESQTVADDDVESTVAEIESRGNQTATSRVPVGDGHTVLSIQSSMTYQRYL